MSYSNDAGGDYKPAPREPTDEEKKSAQIKDIALKAVAGIILVGLGVFGFMHKAQLLAAKEEFIEAAKKLGPGAAVLVFILCVLTTTVCGPSFIWEVSGSVMFYEMYGGNATTALLVGLLACCPGVFLGCIFSFMLGKKYLKPKVEHVIEEHEPLRIINEVIKEEGWPFAFVMRLNPLIPFEMMNLACSMTNLSLRDYSISCLGTMPVVMFEVYSAVSAASMAGGEGGNSEMIATIVKLCIGLVLIGGMAIYAKKKYDLKKDAYAQPGKHHGLDHKQTYSLAKGRGTLATNAPGKFDQGTHSHCSVQ